MNLRQVLITIATVALASACVGELEPIGPGTGGPGGGSVGPDAGPGGGGGGGDETPQALFSSSVQPIVQRCTGEACHAGNAAAPLKFLGTGAAEQYYPTIVQHASVTGGFNPALATLLTMIEPANHYGMVYSEAEKQAITGWLQAEAEARASGGGGGEGGEGGGEPLPPGSSKPLAKWAGCMTKANWDNAQMGTWANKQTNDGDNCSTCHNDGAFRFNTNNNNDNMFLMNRTELYIIGFFTVETDTSGNQKAIPAYDKLVRMGNGSTLHPRYNVDPNNVHFQRLENFYNLTMQTLENDDCGPAEFYSP